MKVEAHACSTKPISCAVEARRRARRKEKALGQPCGDPGPIHETERLRYLNSYQGAGNRPCGSDRFGSGASVGRPLVRVDKERFRDRRGSDAIQGHIQERPRQ